MTAGTTSATGARRFAIYTRSVASGRGAEGVVVNVVRGLRARGETVDLLLEDASGALLDPLRADHGRGRIVDLGAAREGRIGRALTITAVLLRLAWRTLWAWQPVQRAAWVRLIRDLYNDRPPIGALRRYVAAERPDAVLAFQNDENATLLLTSLVARRATRFIANVRNHISSATAGKTSRRAKTVPGRMRMLFWLADGIVAPSQGVADDVIAITGVARERVHVIPNPVWRPELVALMDAPCPHPWLAPGQPPVILGAGKLKPQKDFPTLLAAFARVRRARPSRLIILGSGEAQAELLAEARALGVAADVDLPGHVANPFAWYRRCAVFVLSSRWEGLPNVLIEALACGCPVVSTDCPSGPAEILEGGRHGTLVPVGDAQALAEAIVRTLDQPGDRQARIARAKAFALDPVIAAYAALLAGDRPSIAPATVQPPVAEPCA